MSEAIIHRIEIVIVEAGKFYTSLKCYVKAYDFTRSEAPRSSNRISIHLHQNVRGSDAQQPTTSNFARDVVEEATTSTTQERSRPSLDAAVTKKSDKQRSTKQEEDLDYGYVQSKRFLSPREALAEAQSLEDILETKTQQWVETHSLKSPSDEAPKPTSASPVPPPSTSKSSSKAGKSESSIRRIAREEVVRYRHVERQIESHPRPFSHGTAIPLSQADQSEYKSSSALRSTTKTTRQLEKSRSVTTGASLPRASATTEPSASTAKLSTRSQPKDLQSQMKPDLSVAAKSAKHHSTPSARAPEDIPTDTAAITPAPADESYERVSSSTRYSIRRRRSFETDFTIRPDSSISQRPPVIYVERKDAGPGATSELDEIRNGARQTAATIRSVHHYQGVPDDEPLPKASLDRSATLDPPSRLNDPSQPVYPVSINTPAYLSSHQQYQVSEERKTKESATQHKRRQQHADEPPSPPPRVQRTADQAWSWREDISPNRFRIVRERLIRSKPSSPEQAEAPQSPVPKSKVKRYEIVESVRSLPDERGRPKLREGEEKKKKKALRSILRSPSASQYESQNARSDSISRRVSFSEAIDITMLSPPPSSSNLGQVPSSERGRADPSGRTSYPRYDGQGTRAYRDEREDERYYYERTRRPDPEELAQSARVPDTESDAEMRRRALARALSESPSRERGIHIVDDSRPSRWTLQFSPERPRQSQPKSFRPAREQLSNYMAGSERGSDHSDGIGPYAPFISPTSSMASNDGRAPIFMSGGLSGIATSRAGSQRTNATPRRAFSDVPPPSRVPPPRQSDIPPPPSVPRPSSSGMAQPSHDSHGGNRTERVRYVDSRDARSASDFYPSNTGQQSQTRHRSSTMDEARPRSSTVARDAQYGTGRPAEYAAALLPDQRSNRRSSVYHSDERSSGYRDGRRHWKRSESGRYDDRRYDERRER